MFSVSVLFFLFCFINVSLLQGTGSCTDGKCHCRLDPHPSVEYSCLVSGKITGYRACKNYEPVGTTVASECKEPNYYSPTTLAFMHCMDGYWDYIARCLPECGRVTPSGTELVVGGHRAQKGELPWHAAIYMKTYNPYMQICGGSLISRNIVLSAAHCFYTDKDKLLPPDQFAIAVGKIYRSWNDKMDDGQKSEVKEIQLTQRYQGSEANLQDDIAIVIVTEPFEYNTFIRPVCLNFNYKFEQQQLQASHKGKIAGWGLTAANGQPAPVLQVIDLPYVDVGMCIDNSPPNFREYITSDKMCAGSLENLTALCQGDSGGGLAFPASYLGTERFYLRGVASTAPAPRDENACNTFSYTSFTQITYHENFIKQFWTVSEDLGPQVSRTPRPTAEDCVLPPYPEHGIYNTSIIGARPDLGYKHVSLEVTCQRGYGVEGSASVSCQDGVWTEAVPKCVRQCRLDPHPSVEYRCFVSGDINGSRPCKNHELVGTTVSPVCRKPNYYSTYTLTFMHCVDGYWDYIARCSRECGRVTPSGVELVVGGLPAKKGLPWHAGIYKKTFNPYMQICGGSLISSNIVLSAAHCFYTQIEKQLSADQFAIAVGKIYRPWNDKMDEGQKSDVKEIHLPKRYQGSAANFQDDIAVVIVTEPFEYKTFIQPVCLSFDINFERQQLQANNKGKVASWGITAENGKASPVLQVIDMPYVDVGTCIANSPPNFREYITSDKICAGSQENSTALCKGDSGGGLAFPTSYLGAERFYLRGVVSTPPNNENACNTATYTSLTQIIKHEHFIKQYWTEA